jgi:hypothetical protein
VEYEAMQRLPLSVLLASTLSAPAPAQQYPDVISCLAAVEPFVARDQTYDRFTWSSDPTDSVILRWEAAFSTANPITVATVVEIEGRARRRTEPAETWDDVTARCGLNDAKMEAVEIVPGHDLS